MHDTGNALAPVFACRPRDRAYATALHPSGRALARITHDWVLELRQEGRRTIRQPTPIGSSPAVDNEISRRWGVHGAGWVQFTADGNALLVGDVAERARLGLHDAHTLRLLDRVDRLTGVYPREPIVHWGEGVIHAVAPEGPVTFATNIGDDVEVFGVAEVAGDALRLHGVGDEKVPLSDRIPGERIHGLAIAGDDLYVVDSDGHLTHLRWREGPGAARGFGSAYRFFDESKPQLPALAGLREHGLEPPAERPILNGPLHVLGDCLLVTVEQERVRNDRMSWTPQALLAFARDSLVPRGWASVPDAERDGYIEVLGGGMLCKTIGTETHFWRLAP